MSDLISRQAAIDEITEYGSGDTIYMSAAELKRRIEHLPSAQPETHEERTETHACDCISRQAAIDALYKSSGTGTALKALKALPSAQAEQQWIPCSERLPETNGIYIVTRNISDGFECANITDACYFDGSDTWHDDTRVNHARKYLTDVIAWMPLPDPYKERREE